MATKTIQFSVEGRGEFPLDMLRYDCCWPATGDDVANLDNWRDASRRVTFNSQKANGKPTDGRWASFGWSVVKESV